MTGPLLGRNSMVVTVTLAGQNSMVVRGPLVGKACIAARKRWSSRPTGAVAPLRAVAPFLDGALRTGSDPLSCLTVCSHSSTHSTPPHAWKSVFNLSPPSAHTQDAYLLPIHSVTAAPVSQRSHADGPQASGKGIFRVVGAGLFSADRHPFCFLILRF